MSRAAVRADQLIDAIRKARTIRSGELSKVTGITSNNIGTLLAPAIAARKVVVCKVSLPKGRPCNEYRIGSGMPDTFKPLNLKRPGVALGTAAHRGGTAPRVSLSDPAKPAAAPTTPTFLKPQPAVGKNTGSPPSGSSESLTEARAVTAKATPKPAAGVRLKKEPTTPKASAGDALDITIDDKGTLTIATCEGVIELQPKLSQRLGIFMLGAQGIWNPF